MEEINKSSVLQSIIIKAWENESFKNDLIENPKEAIEAFTGQTIDLPEGKELKAIDQTNQNIIYINIPAEPNMEDLELNEEQLEAVAGGTGSYLFGNLGQFIEDILNHNPGEDGK